MSVTSPEFSVLLSTLALGVSGYTAWANLVRKGKPMATRPTPVTLGFVEFEKEERHPSVGLSTLLFCTAKLGCVIQGLTLSLEKDGEHREFALCLADGTTPKRFSGLHVSKEGIAVELRFLPKSDDTDFQFHEGLYILRLRANLVGKSDLTLLSEQTLSVSKSEATHLAFGGYEVYFDWNLHLHRYVPSLGERQRSVTTEDAIRALLTPWRWQNN